MRLELDALLVTLAERIGAGKSVDPVLLADALREHPEVLGMPRFARVAVVLDRHQETPEPEAVAAPAAISPA
jgi:hypothetical protein